VDLSSLAVFDLLEALEVLGEVVPSEESTEVAMVAMGVEGTGSTIVIGAVAGGLEDHERIGVETEVAEGISEMIGVIRWHASRFYIYVFGWRSEQRYLPYIALVAGHKMLD